MALRLWVTLMAVDGFTSAVDIIQVAGLFERLGLHGLGFSLGVAVNLLPGLRQSSTNAWHSLWMRGGLRQQRWRGLQLFLLTTVSGALRRAEETALAAEARAYTPQRTSPGINPAAYMPRAKMKLGWLDGLIILIVVVSAGLIFI